MDNNKNLRKVTSFNKDGSGPSSQKNSELCNSTQKDSFTTGLPKLNNHAESMHRLKKKFAQKQSIFPDALMLKMFKDAGVEAEPIVVRSVGWLAQELCAKRLQACLMFINSRGEGRVNHITKEVSYHLTKEVVEEVIRSKNFTRRR
uniref:Uncharacterized protein n=1 Tax=Panagrolaimus sp. JU765 TaxID=591449 RepID=A0AC34RCM7_9BILA